MGQGRFSLAEVLRMLRACAPGYTHRVTTHSFIVCHGEKTFALPKGRGVGTPEPRKVNVPDGAIRALVSQLGIDVTCASKHFPGLWK